VRSCSFMRSQSVLSSKCKYHSLVRSHPTVEVSFHSLRIAPRGQRAQWGR
jgi:hypothetical protein